MSNPERLKAQLRYEIVDRAMSIGIGAGFLAMTGAGIWAVASGKPIGILPAIAGAGFAALEFHEAAEATSNISEFRARIVGIEH